MLVLGLGLRKTGLVAAIGAWARTAPLGGQYTRLFALCLVCALLSPFLMTTAVVMVFIPVFIALAGQAGEPASSVLVLRSVTSVWRRPASGSVAMNTLQVPSRRYS